MVTGDSQAGLLSQERMEITRTHASFPNKGGKVQEEGKRRKRETAHQQARKRRLEEGESSLLKKPPEPPRGIREYQGGKGPLWGINKNFKRNQSVSNLGEA